jgi:glycosyltransferase involved in cell wall biosynthesis
VKRVAFVTRAPQVWGAEKSLVTLLTRASAADVDAFVIVDRNSPLLPILHARAIRAAPIDIPVHPAVKHGSLRDAGAKELFQQIARWGRLGLCLWRSFKDVDVAVSFDAWDAPAVLAAGRLRGIPVWLDLHETFDGRVGQRGLGFLARLFSGVISPTEYALREIGIEPGRRYRVVPRPIEGNAKPPRTKLPSNAPVVGMVGQFAPHKGHAVLVEAVSLARRAIPCELLFVGASSSEGTAGPYERSIRKLVADLGVPAIFVGQTADVWPWIDRLSVLVNLSEHEAFGRTVAEALSRGVFPLVSEGTGAAEIVRDTGVGAIAPRDAGLLANHLVEILNDDLLLASALAAGPEAVRSAYLVDAVAPLYFRLVTSGG